MTVAALGVRIARRLQREARALKPVAKRTGRRIANLGWAYQCPVCGSHLRRWLPDGPHPVGLCPVCYSYRRQRVAWLYMLERTDLSSSRPKDVLHFAPEWELSLRLRQLPGVRYVSCDADPGRATVQVDIQKMHFADASFDVVLCCHVLEHVDDDRRAMRELRRVLKPGGWALIQVPMSDRPTDEDPAVTDPAERARRFWQPDHVRLYGPDVAERLQEEGFDVHKVLARDFLSERTMERIGTESEETLFICRKAA